MILLRLAAAWRYAVTHRAPSRVDVAARLAPYVDTRPVRVVYVHVYHRTP